MATTTNRRSTRLPAMTTPTEPPATVFPARTITLAASPPTPTLHLTELHTTDAPALVATLAHPTKGAAIYAVSASIPSPYTIDSAHAFLTTKRAADVAAGRVATFAIRADGGELIGIVGTFVGPTGPAGVMCAAAERGIMRVEDGAAELGYWVDGDWTGKGVATAAAKEVVRLTREEVGVQVVATCFADNKASARVLEKAGLVYRGVVEAMVLRPEWGPRDCKVFSSP